MNTNLKKILYYSTKLSQVLGCNLHIRKKSGQVPKVVYYPPFQTESDLADQVNRVRWYIPRSTGATIWMGKEDSLDSVDLDTLPVPKHQRTPNTSEANPKILLCDLQEIDRQLKKADVICVWNTKTRHWIKRLFPYLSRVRIVDPDFYKYTESHTNAALLWYDLLTPKERMSHKQHSLLLLKKLFNEQGGEKRAYLFGTGPSIKEAENYSFDDGVRIICNTIIANDNLLDQIRPQILTFIDSVFHFGVSQYCDKFAKDVIKVVRRYKTYCISNEVGAGLMRLHYPELKDYIIGIPALRFGGPVALTPDNFKTRAYPHGVLLRMMLPLAAGLSKKVVLIGFDGRKPDEGYFWKHNASTQYNDSMEDVFNTHKAFFKDTDYSEHYAGHCSVLSKMLDHFEANGTDIEVLGNSYVPALQKRLLRK